MLVRTVEVAMPVHLSEKGATVLEPGGKVVKRFKSRAKARAYATARNLGHARSKGYKVPAPLKKKR
jgi:hypothetical protein